MRLDGDKEKKVSWISIIYGMSKADQAGNVYMKCL